MKVLAQVIALGFFTQLTLAAPKQETPFDKLPHVPSFTLTSADLKDGGMLGTAQMSGMFGAGGQDLSPQLTWSGFPKETKSFAITVYDPDAPTGSGFWHWAVFDIPAVVTSLPAGAGAPNSTLLPKEAIQLPNDAGVAQFLGAAPPVGHGMHHYFITVYAVDVASLGVPKTATPAFLGFNLFTHTLARAIIVGKAERKK
jgi:Raf kinase inhibitor-like YbhB/YbcL family protein